MRKLFFKTFCVFMLFLIAAESVQAQRTSRRRGTGTPTNPPPGTNPPTTDPGGTVPPAGTGMPPGGLPANIPITFDTASESIGGGKSIRPTSAFDKTFVNERVPLEYEHLRWDDALYTQTVWKELDLREKMNQVFMYGGSGDEGSQMFIDIILRAVNSGDVTAFADEYFRIPLKLEEVLQLTAGGMDTNFVRDLYDPDKITGISISKKNFDSKSVLKLRVKDDYIFDRESSRMFVRTNAIAPVKTMYFENGQERGGQVLFWVYYPDIRATLAKNEVYNPKNMGASRMTWEELFESHMYSSYVLKSTIDNPQNRMIRQYIKDPILALLEGENIKEKIFNYEQDLWAY